MGSLYVGSSGLQTSQNALNTTAHNLANVETQGYVRQQTVLQSSQYRTIGQSYISPMQTGLGVSTQTVRQVRDTFLDKSYRTELGRQGFYDSQYETASEIENLLGELNGVAFQDTMKEFWTNLQELAKEPDNLVKRAALVETSVSFVERAENIYKQLSEYQVNLNTKVSNYVQRINDIGDEIVELNDKICFYESNRQENANDLRDKRNSLLDELGKMISITYRENDDGRITVNAEGMPFVTEMVAMKMDTITVTELRKKEMGDEAFFDDESGNMENSEMLIPIWSSYGDSEVFNRDNVPETVNNTDVGSLKGLLLARGTKVGKYVDIPVAPDQNNYLNDDGEVDMERFEEATRAYEDAVKKYNKTINPSIIMSSQAQFDQLIHGIVTKLNDIFCPNKEVVIPGGTEVTLADGSKYTYEEDTVIHILDTDRAPVGQDGPPGTMGVELFSRKSMDRYLPPQSIDIIGGETIENAYIFIEENPTNNYSLYTVGEITVNQELIANKSLMPLSSNKNTGDYDVAAVERLLEVWNTPFATIDPNTLTKNSFSDYYNCYIGTLATKGEKMKTISDSQAGMVESIDNQRTNVIGVSSDEELTNIIKFQHAYNAAARYVNVIDEMLEHIVTRL
ncbi:MAG: flagellar hook-associated protein FlgK [Clostridiales bacterium]|nr:flagellar hook-associated protein FlgK [Clostridiales bacterium]